MQAQNLTADDTDNSHLHIKDTPTLVIDFPAMAVGTGSVGAVIKAFIKLLDDVVMSAAVDPVALRAIRIQAAFNLLTLHVLVKSRQVSFFQPAQNPVFIFQLQTQASHYPGADNAFQNFFVAGGGMDRYSFLAAKRTWQHIVFG